MISYFDFIFPVLVMILGLFKFAKVFYKIMDRGEQYYIFKQSWWKHVSDMGLIIFSVVIVAIFAWSKLDIDSIYIYNKYFADLKLLFDSNYYTSLKIELKELGHVDYQALLSFKFMLGIIPNTIAITPTLFASFLPRILSSGLYVNGIFDGINYYPYDDIRSYTTEQVNGKVTITFKRREKTHFQNDKVYELTIYEDELSEVESYLRHEIRDTSVFEENYSNSNDKNQKTA